MSSDSALGAAVKAGSVVYNAHSSAQVRASSNEQLAYKHYHGACSIPVPLLGFSSMPCANSTSDMPARRRGLACRRTPYPLQVNGDALLRQVCLTIMTAGAHYYFLREDRIIAEQQSKLRQINERNARLQQELVMLNASIGSIVQGLDKVSHSVGSAAKHVVAPSASLPGGADASALGAVLASVREENEHLKKALSALPATAPAIATAAGAAGGALLGRRWLTIGIPTVPRKGDLRYLEQTVQVCCCVMALSPQR